MSMTLITCGADLKIPITVIWRLASKIMQGLTFGYWKLVMAEAENTNTIEEVYWMV